MTSRAWSLSPRIPRGSDLIGVATPTATHPRIWNPTCLLTLRLTMSHTLRSLPHFIHNWVSFPFSMTLSSILQPSIPIYHQCVDASCSCTHSIGGIPSQLKPCRVAPFLFGDSKLECIEESDRLFLWNGLYNSFGIVDDDCAATYECDNYDSILAPEASAEMSALLEQELLDHKVIVSSTKPKCIHSLGAVWKSSGALRPITDCSRPEGTSINNFMTTTFESFTYNSIQDAVDILTPGDYMAVIDISSAYRSVSVSERNSYFQGLSWNFGSGPVFLRDLRLCFGLRCAPNMFDRLSRLIVSIAISKGASGIINYLDDFLVVAPDYKSQSPPDCHVYH